MKKITPIKKRAVKKRVTATKKNDEYKLESFVNGQERETIVHILSKLAKRIANEETEADMEAFASGSHIMGSRVCISATDGSKDLEVSVLCRVIPSHAGRN